MKFTNEDSTFFSFLDWVESSDNISKTDCINHIGCFTGSVNFARYIALYELYKRVKDLPGDIIEVGVWKGQTLLFLGKLISIFEPHSPTLVVGCDRFDDAGMQPNPKDDKGFDTGGQYKSNYEFVEQLIDKQILHCVKLKKMDCATEFSQYFEENNHQRFKLIFLDCGIYSVVAHSIESLFPRLVPGGILVTDQFAMQGAPGEAQAVSELLSEYHCHSIPWTRSPNFYIVKPPAEAAKGTITSVKIDAKA